MKLLLTSKIIQTKKILHGRIMQSGGSPVSFCNASTVVYVNLRGIFECFFCLVLHLLLDSRFLILG